MRVGRVATADGEELVVEIRVDDIVEVVGARSADLVDVCTSPERWNTRGRSWDFESGDVRFLSPVATPPSIRDFSAYSDHTRHVLEALGRELPKSWFDEPVFYFSNPRAVIGPTAAVRRPQGSRRLDYEAELAAVVGRPIDANTEDVHSALAGFTLMNDWSARDLAAREMKHSLGPAKGKDFATSLGPWIVTPDEFPTLRMSGVVDVSLTVSVNGVVTTDSSTADMSFDWERLLRRAADNTELVPGDVIGAGTVGYGCLLELRTLNVDGDEKYRWLDDGDVVELTADKFGTIRSVVEAVGG